MTEAQIENVSFVIGDLYKVQDIRISDSDFKFIAGITYIEDTKVKYSRGSHNHKGSVFGEFQSQDFLSLPEMAELLRCYGFRLGYPSKSFLYDLREEKTIRFVGDTRKSLANWGTHAEEFLKLRKHHRLMCSIPILPGWIGVLNCWIGHVRQVLKEERQSRLLGKWILTRKRLPYRLATIDYSK